MGIIGASKGRGLEYFSNQEHSPLFQPLEYRFKLENYEKNILHTCKLAHARFLRKVYRGFKYRSE